MATRKVMLVLGSGATVGALFKVIYENRRWTPPLDRDFFRSRLVKRVFTKAHFPALWWYRTAYPEVFDLEKMWSTVDLYAKLALGGVISQERAYRQNERAMAQRARRNASYRLKLERECSLWRLPGMAGWELRELVSTVLGTMVPPVKRASPLHALIKTLQDSGVLYGIVTFNYDLSLEALLKTELVTMWPAGGALYEAAKGKIPLYKLHGSLDWQETERGVHPKERDESRPVQMIFSENGGWVQPCIIGPTLFKQEITIDFQVNESALFYKRLWRMCWDSLREVNALVFVGFSFPPTDFHARSLFQSAHLQGKFERVAICIKDKTGDETINRVRRIFGLRPKTYKKGLEDLAGKIDDLLRYLA